MNEIDEIVKCFIPEGELEQVREHFLVKNGKLVVRYPRIISSLLVLEPIKTLTQGGIIP